MSLSHLALKATSFLTTAAAVHISLSPPNPPVMNNNCPVPNTFFEKFIQSITFFSKSMVWIGVLWDLFGSVVTFTLQTCLNQKSPAMTRRICEPDPRMLWTIHPMMFLGASIAVVAAVLRVWCFKTMGRFFTFEISIRSKHELITSGPYAWVRHPSYTGIYCTLLGASAVLCSPGSWMMECGLPRSGSALLLILWMVKCAFVFKGTSARLRVEDKILKGTFGETWEEYARNVPNSFLPGII